MNGSSKENGQHPVWTATTPIKEDKNRSAQCAELHIVFLAVRVKLNNSKSPYVWVFTDSRVVANGQAEGQWKPGLLKGCSYGERPYGNHYGI